MDRDDSTDGRSIGDQHTIEIESIQLFRSTVGPDEAELLVGEATGLSITGREMSRAFDLEFHKEKKITFECTCGRRFRKPETAYDHLEEVRDDD